MLRVATIRLESISSWTMVALVPGYIIRSKGNVHKVTKEEIGIR